MTNLKTHRWIVMILIAALLPAAAAMADWNPGDSYKMHYPQLPDPNGWDVAWPNLWLGDDWQCTETGAVTDIHLWLSFYGWSNQVLPPGMANATLQVQIWGNMPVGPDGYSIPYTPNGLPLWQRTFSANSSGTNDLLTARYYGHGEQGWFDPLIGIKPEGEHSEYFQINIDNIANPFVQNKDEIYWLVTNLNVPGAPAAGWKTSTSHFMDDAVFYYDNTWWEVSIAGASRDLAFVITTPEPSMIVLLAVAGAALLPVVLRRHRRR